MESLSPLICDPRAIESLRKPRVHVEKRQKLQVLSHAKVVPRLETQERIETAFAFFGLKERVPRREIPFLDGGP